MKLISTLLCAGLLFVASLHAEEAKTTAIRESRTFGFSLDLGWNTLAGVGLDLHYYPIANVGVDAAAGLGFNGFRTGLRGRYLFSKGTGTPMLGVGVYRAGGWGSNYTREEDSGVLYRVDPTFFLQLDGGFEVLAKEGLMFQFHTGWVIAMSDPITYYSTVPNETTRKALHIVTSGGFQIGINIGYMFDLS